MLKTSLFSQFCSTPQLYFVRFKNPTKMAKKNFALEHVQKMRNARRQNFGQMAPASVYFQVLGNGAEGGPKSLFLFTSHNRYLFNCGEGTQRIASEFTGSKSLAQLCNIFITKKSWENIGGLPGMCLSVRTTGCPDVKLHGPDGMMKIYEATKHFVILHQFGVQFHSASDGRFEDPVLKVDHVPLKPFNSPPLISPDPTYCNWNSDIQSVDESKPEIDQTVMSYILTFKGKTGKIDMEKCRKLGLKPGPIIGLLKKGQMVTLEDGREIHPHQVQYPEEAEMEYLIVDCPSQDYLDPLLNETKLKSENLDKIQGIFHFSPLNVVQDERYSIWMNSFSADIKNVMLNEASEGYGTVDGLRYNAQVHTVCPEVYKKILAKEPGKISDYSKIKAPLIQAKTNMKIHVRPFEKEVKEPVEFNENELEFTDEFTSELAKARKQVKVALKKYQNEPEFPKVTFLGTGSSVPNKYRNVSSILIESSLNSYVILDCGEGSLLQLHRHFGRQKSLEILRQLKGIYISHLHADHHLGLIHLVLEREKAFQDIQKEPTKLYVLAPARIANYLQVYHKHFETILTNLHFIRNEHLLVESTVGQDNQIYPEVEAELLEYLNMNSIKTCRAFHCPGAYCVAMVTKENFKFLYSGDTRPIDAIIELGQDGQDTDLLIHESTMEHHMLDDCKSKRHTTFTEAINIAEDMKCKRALFTHFSQRYSKVPLFEEFRVEKAKNTAVVMDNTSVSMRTLDAIPETYSALEALFGLEINELGERKDNFKLSHFKSPFDSDEKFEDEENSGKKRRTENVFKRPKLIEYQD